MDTKNKENMADGDLLFEVISNLLEESAKNKMLRAENKMLREESAKLRAENEKLRAENELLGALVLASEIKPAHVQMGGVSYTIYSGDSTAGQDNALITTQDNIKIEGTLTLLPKQKVAEISKAGGEGSSR